MASRSANILSGIETFVTLVNTGSFTNAAQSIGKSASFVSKEISRLEDRMGIRLLNRTTRSLTLTDMGALYFEQCRHIIAGAVAAEQSIMESRDVPKGQLKISAPVSFGLGYLADVFPEFLNRNPDLDLKIDYNDRMVDVVKDGFDVVLRVGRLADSSLTARKINSSSGLTLAAPDYWEKHGKPKHPSELSQHVCLGYSLSRTPSRWEYRDPSGKSVFVSVSSRMECNSAELNCALAVAGIGVTRLPEFACRRELDAGLLLPVLQDFALPPLGIYAVYPHRRHLAPKVRAFIDFMVEKFGTGAGSMPSLSPDPTLAQNPENTEP